MNTYEMTLAAGAVWALDVPGNFFRLLDSTAVCDVQLTRAGVPQAESKQVLAGLWLRPRQAFTGVRITNGATPQTIKIGIADGEAGYDRMQVAGTVSVTGSTVSATPLQGIAISDIAANTIGTAAVQLLTVDPARRSARFYNAGTADIYLGGSGVTVANGCVKIAPGQTWVEEASAGAAWYGISGSAGQAIRLQVVS